MKKYDDIIFSEIESDSDGYESFYRYDQVVKAIKIAQIDAIDETVRRCAEKAKMFHKYYPKEGRGNYKKYCEFKGTYPERYDSYGESIGVDVFQVNKQSILQVAEELKKELE
jgi:hypothetical protein